MPCRPRQSMATYRLGTRAGSPTWNRVSRSKWFLPSLAYCSLCLLGFVGGATHGVRAVFDSVVFNQALEAWDTAKVTNMERSKWQESAGNESGSGGETAVCLCMWLVWFATSVVSSLPH